MINAPQQGRRKEKIASTANIGPELEVMIKSGQFVGPLGSPDLGGLGACSPRNFWDFKYFEVPSGAF